MTRDGRSDVKMLLPLMPDAMRLEVREGWTDPIHGWLPGEREYVPAPLVHVAADGYEAGYANFATVLVPFADGAEPAVAAEAAFTEPNDAVVRLRWGDGTRDEVHWAAALSMALGKVGHIDTDAALLHRRFDAGGALAQGLAAYGTYVKPHAPAMRPEPATFRIDGQ